MSVPARSVAGPAPTISIRNYAIVTAAYWAFTLTDGALRMLVLLHFNQLGYTPVQLAFLFLLYEFFGIVTNLVGGWIASRTGVRFTLVLGLMLQVVALGLLAFLNAGWSVAVSVAYVMGCQALSGIAKDLTKMSAKSAVKVLVPKGDDSGLFKWVAVLTGSKNALKGAGFFVGGFLLSVLGFRGALSVMATGVLIVLLLVWPFCRRRSGRRRRKPRSRAFSPTPRASTACRWRGWHCSRRGTCGLSSAFRSSWRACLAGPSRRSAASWRYGSLPMAPCRVRLRCCSRKTTGGKAPGPVLASTLGLGLAAVTALIPIGLRLGAPPALTMLGGLVLFGIVFALNSSVHSYLVLAYSESDRVSLSVGFYYMANACGRLLGTLLSGVLYQYAGVSASLWGAVVLAAAAGFGAMLLPPVTSEVDWSGAKGDD